MKKIGINMGCYGDNLPPEEQIRYMSENGFETTFMGSESPLLDSLVPALRRAGIVCENCHAPFNKINDIWFAGEAGELMLERLLSGVRACAKNEIPTLVVHLSSGEQAPRINDIGSARFDRLMEEARRCGVTVAYENQRKLANLSMAMEQYPEAGFCWDVGHEACFTNGREYMPLFGTRIVALHLQDNHCEYNRDEHLLPYDGSINMELAARRIAESGYGGSIMLEVIRRNSNLYDALTPAEYYRRAADAARRFAKAVEGADTTV